ncbi:MAG TPA: hypothetical protein PK176_07685 [Acidobacteriota bacterium]|nr:hypothetical protein [Acidobacteriota bacterium]HQM63181.1 hypothetical protein [Acidobacteriota bacterium]
MIRTVTVCLVLMLLAVPFLAADTASSKPADDWQILRDKLKADKKLLVAENLTMTTEQARAFWPIYDAYQADLTKINERIKKLVLAYADVWNKGAVKDEDAKKLIAEMLSIEEAELHLKKTFLPKFEAVLPATQVMRYFQIENKIRTLVRLDLAANIPLAD